MQIISHNTEGAICKLYLLPTIAAWQVLRPLLCLTIRGYEVMMHHLSATSLGQTGHSSDSLSDGGRHANFGRRKEATEELTPVLASSAGDGSWQVKE